MSELIVVRHGQSEYNILLTDNLDSSITKEGERQVAEAAKFLAENVAHLNTFLGRVSPYWRTLQTARIIQEHTGIEFEVDHGPREVMISYKDGSTIRDRREEFPEFIWPKEIETTTTFLSETPEVYTQRMAGYYDELKDGRFLVVSHGGPTKCLIELAAGKQAAWEPHVYPENATINWVRDGEILAYNKVAY